MLIYLLLINHIMALDDEYLDPNPICVEGIEEECAVDRCYGLGFYSRGAYWTYRMIARKATALFSMEAGVFISDGNPWVFLLGIATIAGAAVCQHLVSKEHRWAAEFLAVRHAARYRCSGGRNGWQ